MLSAAARWVMAVTFLALPLCPRQARAHFVLLYPPSRGVTLESAPCGGAGSVRGAAPTVLRPGQTIVVQWNVQVDHLQPPKFRIAFDDAGQDFPAPVGPDDTSALPLFLDGVLTAGGGVQTKEIALPNVECDNCTLQMLQYLSPKPPYTPGNFYYQCADITLSAGARAPMDAAGGGPDGGVAPLADAAMRETATQHGNDANDANDGNDVSDDSAGRRVDSGSPRAATGASGCQHAGHAGTGWQAPGLLGALLALARRAPRERSST